MANNYFQFKQFKVEQDGCAMKVCTDSCTLGAITNFSDPGYVLDIGTGTGLLSLMLAQKYSCRIDAIDIDEKAVTQAKINIENSPWKEKIHLYHTSIQNFSAGSSTSYDLIVSNPPFFENHLKSPDNGRNIALHTETLSSVDLIQSVKKLLSEKGSFFILLPVYESEQFEKLAVSGKLFPQEKIYLYHSPSHKPFRTITAFGNFRVETKTTDLFIKDLSGDYSPGFKALLKDYYLIF